MKINKTLLALALGLMVGTAANAQVISYSPRTGDIWVDTELGYINDYGREHRDYFVDDVVSGFGAPRYLVNDLINTRNWAPADVYYACGIAYQLRRPCSDVVREYESNRGQGWGVIAKRMGIKPGSAEFHALKGQMGKSKGKLKTYSDDPRRRDDSLRIDGRDDDKAKGKDWSDGKGNGNGKDKGAKGNGKGNGNGKKDKG